MNLAAVYKYDKIPIPYDNSAVKSKQLYVSSEGLLTKRFICIITCNIVKK